jgi:hypothetical protein
MTPATPNRVRKPRLALAIARALLVTFLATLLSFAVSLLLAIVGMAIYARIRGITPDMTFAYRHIAAPIAAMVGAVVLVLSFTMEIRHYRQAKALASIERVS